jgi:Tfp pilus assembly protein PilZ
MATEYKERRRYPRYPCDTGVRVRPEKTSAGYWGTLADISLGGCYIYTFSPLPVGQIVTLIVKINDAEVDVAGKVVSTHPGVGMGVAFAGFVHEDGEEQLKGYLSQLAAQPRPKDTVAVFH